MTATVDLSPIIVQYVIPLLVPLLLGVATWALNRVAKYAHFQIQDGQRAIVETAIRNGIAYAEKGLAGHESLTVDARAAAVVNYVLPKVPDALKGLGVTPDHLAELVVARLPA